jgi:hypothetical protein
LPAIERLTFFSSLLFFIFIFLFFSFPSGLWRAGSSAVTALIRLRKSSSHLPTGLTSQFTCFTGTEVQILTRDRRLATASLTAKTVDWELTDFCVLSLLALLAQKYEY